MQFPREGVPRPPAPNHTRGEVSQPPSQIENNPHCVIRTHDLDDRRSNIGITRKSNVSSVNNDRSPSMICLKSCFLSGDDVRGIFSCSIIIRLRLVLKGFVAYDFGRLPTHDILHDHDWKLSLCRRYASARILTQLRAYFSILYMVNFTAVYDRISKVRVRQIDVLRKGLASACIAYRFENWNE